jgi:hypothetical protein
LRLFRIPLNLASAHEMRRILFSTIKILISATLLYFALRKVNLSELASRINVASLARPIRERRFFGPIDAAAHLL